MEKTVERTIDNVWYGKMDLDEMLDRYTASDKFEFIPAIGRKVYIVKPSSRTITEETVYALGRDFFLIDRRFAERGCTEFRYDEYYKRWFLTLEEAKKYMQQYLKDDEELNGEGWDGIWMVKPF